MGTNYYMINKRLKETIEEEYNDDNDVLQYMLNHNSIPLAKSGVGWKVLLYCNMIMANDWEAWKWTLEQGQYIIYDEYAREIDVSDFIEMVESKQNSKSHRGDCLIDEIISVNGYEFFDKGEYCDVWC